MITTIENRLLQNTVRSASGILVLFFLGCSFFTGTEDDSNQLSLDTIRGYPPMDIPEDNPTTQAGIKLGRMLFYDPILSGDSSQACASCHTQAFAFSDNGSQFSTGITGAVGGANAPIIVNPGWNTTNFWDGRAATLEDQALGPVTNPIEMASPSWTVARGKLQAHPDYPALFEKAFGTSEITTDLTVKAIAQFERTLISKNSKFDRVVRGEEEYTNEEARAFFTFMDPNKGDCFHCHVLDMWYDNSFHNNGLDSIIPPGSGLGGVTGKSSDDGKWKTPTLRNVEYSAPYMHDGRFATLEEVVDHYSDHVKLSPTVDPLVTKRIRGDIDPLSDEDKRLIVLFMKMLSDPEFISNEDFSNPFVD